MHPEIEAVETMKKALLSALAVLPVLTFAQTITINTAPANADQVWYRLSNDEVHTTSLASWDLGFEINGFSASILVNTAKGVKIYNTNLGVDAWDELTAMDVDNWDELNNSETDWSAGALTDGADGNFNLGWGTYNVNNHVTAGTELFVVTLTGNVNKKLRVDALSAGVYYFTYADLNGLNEQSGEVAKADFLGRNFGYWDLTTNTSVDIEPENTAWDLLFTKYLSDLGVMWYGVAGVLQNSSVEVAQVDGIGLDIVELADAEGLFSTDINIIGSDWKTFTGGQYVYAADRSYFVRDVDGAIWRLVFTGYGGGATGTMTFEKEFVGTTSVTEITVDNGSVVLYPNPVQQGTGAVNILADIPGDRAQVRVLDLNGREVFTGSVNGLDGFSARRVEMGALPTGMYMLQLVHAHGVATARMIVE